MWVSVPDGNGFRLSQRDPRLADLASPAKKFICPESRRRFMLGMFTAPAPLPDDPEKLRRLLG
jgi:hypothetical protein